MSNKIFDHVSITKAFHTIDNLLKANLYDCACEYISKELNRCVFFSSKYYPYFLIKMANALSFNWTEYFNGVFRSD